MLAEEGSVLSDTCIMGGRETSTLSPVTAFAEDVQCCALGQIPANSQEKHAQAEKAKRGEGTDWTQNGNLWR